MTTALDSRRVISSLNLIGKLYSRILDDNFQIVIPQAIQRVVASRKAYDQRRRGEQKTWGYIIDPSQPLRFKPSEIRQLGLQADIYCNVQWADDMLPVSQDIKVRIWSTHPETIWDENRDSGKILEELTAQDWPLARRVVARFHLDRVNEDQGKTLEYHPEYHLQFGGKPEDDELWLLPKKVNIPRLCHHPMELFLTCQMVAANFFWNEYLQIREKREWRDTLFFYQHLLLEEYYRKCVRLIEANELLMDNLEVPTNP